MELPYDESGATLEILERASKAAAEWSDKRNRPTAALQHLNLRAREAEHMLLGEDPATGRPVLMVRMTGGFQISFVLDRRIIEELRNRPPLDPEERRTSSTDYAIIAEDIEWFQQEWCTLYAPPSNADLRRGSAALRRLLVDNAIQRTWIQLGFEKQPSIAGPDVEALAKHHGVDLNYAVSLVAGGGCISGMQMAMIGCYRVDNPETGKKAGDDEGFAVKVSSVTRDAREAGSANELTALVEKSWTLSEYLDATSAIRLGIAVSRQDVVQYFANYMGGVHLDSIDPKIRKKTATYKLVDSLRGMVRADTMDGLYFELLSIGQAIGKSADLRALVSKIRAK